MKIKKIQSVFLAFLVILSAVLTACSGGNTETSAEQSGSFGESAAASSEASAEESTEASGEESSEPAEVFTYRTPVTVGCSYTTSKPAGDSYADSYGIELTDGLVSEREGAAYIDAHFAGYGIGAYNILSVIVDLGETKDRLYSFEVDYLDIDSSGILAPSAFAVAVSDDGKTFTSLGSIKIKGESNSTCKTAVIEIPHSVSARYIRFNITTGNYWVFIDEVTAYADIEGGSGNDGFKKAVSASYADDMPTDAEITESLGKVSSGVPDKTLERRNIVKDKAYKASVKSQGDFADDGRKLTDGKTGAGIESDTWAAYPADNGVEFVFDIGRERTDIAAFSVNAAAANVLQIGYPVYVSFYVSSNKNDWYPVGMVFAPTTYDAVYEFVLELPVTVKARYVKAVLPSSELYAQYLLDEIGVYAYWGETVKPEISGSWLSPSPDTLKGVHDVFLAYHSKSNNWSASTFMNIIGYTDKEGNTVDTLFDGVLFLMSGGFPSNSDSSTGGSNRYNMSDVNWLIKTLFADGKNISALEEAAGDLKTRLKLDDGYKVKYFLSLYTPNSEDFGDVDGDGVSENSLDNTGRKKIAGYLVDEFYKEFALHEYKNIEFGGFYWYNEGISDNLKPVVSYVTDKVHEHNDQVFWIPYYQAAGYTSWKDVGIDVACLQPNYAFSDTVPKSRLLDAAKIAKKNGMCIEIEMDYRAGGINTASTQRYFDYLASGAELGYMTDSIHMYYIGLTNFDGDAYRSDTGRRLMYDYTYRFIKGTLEVHPEVIDVPEAHTDKDSEIVIDLVSDVGYKQFETFVSPSHGSVTITADGKAVYYPAKGFTGKDTFGFRYTERLGWSDECTVTVNVG